METTYSLVWAGGDSMRTVTSLQLPVSVPLGQMLDLSIDLIAPNTGGHYMSLWKLSNTNGVQFGIGDSASNPFWVDINIININAVVNDFVANASYAQRKSGAGALPYPEFQVQAGNRLQTLVNCEFGAAKCYVTFRFDYLLPNGMQKSFRMWKEAADKRFYLADLDLSSLARQNVRFVFMLLGSGFVSGESLHLGLAARRLYRDHPAHHASFHAATAPTIDADRHASLG